MITAQLLEFKIPGISSMAMKNKRGWRHELEVAQAQQSKHARTAVTSSSCSALATELLKMWSAGEISATRVQAIAHAAVLDGAQHAELGLLASTGSYGEHAGNVHRDINQIFSADLQISNASLVATSAVDPKTSSLEEVEAATFLPHVLLQDLAKYDNHLENIMCADQLVDFWSGVEQTGDPRLVDHPMLQWDNWKSTCIPVFIHGDGVEYHDRDSLMV